MNVVNPGQPILSVVLPFYNEADHVGRVLTAIPAAIEPLQLPFEIIMVDDGSTDGTWSELQTLCHRDARLQAVRFSRNFGKEAALSAGLAKARGQAVITMDGDLQHPPEVIARLVARWQRGDVDIVDAVKRHANRGGPLKNLAATLFYTLHRRLTGMEMNGSSDFKLLDRRVVSVLNTMGERRLFFRGLCDWLGFRRDLVTFDVADRVGGRSKWSLKQLLRLALNGITAFTSAPLHVTTGLGCLFLAFSAPLAVQTLYMKLTAQAVSGFTTVILLLLMLGSAILISLGIIGIYIAQIFDEVKARPRYLVSEQSETGEGRS
ncbi:glycosyltransferase family 2 protein [Acanthopleuribacter pedis]|uniref:Glycosyltransferase family 2 protein n=1 Tax=Acanthopleuribacter pedis TaxID=442870 RepID=A0A8J7QBQ4_9BACT|nr:glycosyltransferase family 2 protein [Acanthopleuribacter pedis]MBO1318026.1 glycosyltransferase family 2 protein [Acanthopleuribacter pedis]